MAEDPKTTAQPSVPQQTAATPVPVKPEPVEDIGETLDQFFTGVQTVGVVSMRTLLERLKKKADDIITTLDSGDPPKKS